MNVRNNRQYIKYIELLSLKIKKTTSTDLRED